MSTDIIDIHFHYNTPKFLDYLEQRGAALEDGMPAPRGDLDELFQVMDDSKIKWALLSHSSPHHVFIDDKERGLAMTREINETYAAIKQKRPDRIGFQAVIPLPFIDEAIEEAVYAMDTLGANGIKLATNSRGQYLGDPSLEPLFAELNKRGTVCNLHPHRPYPQQEGIFSAGPVPLFEFLCDSTRAVLNMIGNGVLDRYPNIKVIVPHCGAFLPYIRERFRGIAKNLKGQGLMADIDIKANYERLYFDTAGSPVPHLLENLLTVTSPDKIMFGSDYPWTIASRCPKAIAALENMIDDKPHLKPYKEMIFHENAEKVFGLI
jgi:predicted TIM-barrel fold metal-dependent hydrolase